MRPGIATPRCRSAWATRASTTSSTRPPTTRACSRRYIRKSVATWSLRERPARRRPPRSVPTRSMRPRSSAVWTSSSSSAGVNAPESTSASRRSRPSIIPSRCSSERSPAACRTRAWAREPAMSCGARRQSKWVLFDSAASAWSGPPAKRPPQRLTRAAGAPGRPRCRRRRSCGWDRSSRVLLVGDQRGSAWCPVSAAAGARRRGFSLACRRGTGDVRPPRPPARRCRRRAGSCRRPRWCRPPRGREPGRSPRRGSWRPPVACAAPRR